MISNKGYCKTKTAPLHCYYSIKTQWKVNRSDFEGKKSNTVYVKKIAKVVRKKSPIGSQNREVNLAP